MARNAWPGQVHKRRDEYCEGQYPEGCGDHLVENKQMINRVMVRALVRMVRYQTHYGSPIHLKDVFTGGKGTNDYSEHQNAQKLKYFGLTSKYYDEEGVHTDGYWFVTERGFRFVAGEFAIRPVAWTFRDEVVERDGDKVFFDQVREFVRLRLDWASDQRIHEMPDIGPEADEEDDDGGQD
jgi:hypothetical protein